MNRAIIAGGIIGLSILAGGCGSSPSPVFAKSERVSASSIAGTWVTTDGRTFTIRETPGGGLRIKDRDGNEHTGVLVSIGGRSIIEIPMSDSSRMSDDASPVYHYGLVKVSGDTMEHQGLSAAWLTGQQQLSSAIVAAPLASGAGTVTATDPETMRGLLKKAAADPNAWGVKEVLTRKP
ncbi:MAG: hypothetical protein KF902_01355 [Phycisphaeraceae bacterium]|nr:hypothetical protein [Phycisphaeraceae bacterium]